MVVRMLRSASFAVLAVLVIAACTDPPDPASQARDLERRILAPCCRRQTLEDHESELAHALRTEIERRVHAGESSGAIEEDLVRRYGEDVRAMPRGTNPRALLGGAVGIVLALAWIIHR